MNYWSLWQQIAAKDLVVSGKKILFIKPDDDKVILIKPDCWDELEDERGVESSRISKRSDFELSTCIMMRFDKNENDK